MDDTLDKFGSRGKGGRTEVGWHKQPDRLQCQQIWVAVTRMLSCNVTHVWMQDSTICSRFMGKSLGINLVLWGMQYQVIENGPDLHVGGPSILATLPGDDGTGQSSDLTVSE